MLSKIILIVIFVVIIILAKGMKNILPDEVIIIERNGSFHSTLNKGIHFLIPFVDKVKLIPWQVSYEADSKTRTLYKDELVDRLYLKEQTLELFQKTLANKVLVMTIFLQIEDPVKLAYSDNFISKLPDLVYNSTKEVYEGLSEEQKKDIKYYNDFLSKLNEQTKNFGCKINKIILKEEDSKKYDLSFYLKK